MSGGAFSTIPQQAGTRRRAAMDLAFSVAVVLASLICAPSLIPLWRHLTGVSFALALAAFQFSAEGLVPLIITAIRRERFSDFGFNRLNLGRSVGLAVFRRELLAFCISAKRYTPYEREGKKITIIDPKAHGLGYLYPPADSPPGWDEEHEIPKWVYEAWEWLVRHGLQLIPNRLPSWSKCPQMMRMAVTTYDLLKRMHRWNRFRPFNSFFVPVLANCGQPANVDPQRFALVTRFERDQSKWMDAVCFNIDDPQDGKEYKLGTGFDSPHFGERPIVETFEGLLYRYFYHPEWKSLGPDGQPCQLKTRGRLRRPHVVGGERHRIGKEVDRRWEEGDDLEAMRQKPLEYMRPGRRAPEPTVRPSLHLSKLVKEIGIRKLMRQGFGRRIVQKILRREPVKASTYRDYERRIEEYSRTTKRRKRVLV